MSLRIYEGDGINTDGADDELDYGAGGPEATDNKNPGRWTNGEVRPHKTRIYREIMVLLARTL